MGPMAMAPVEEEDDYEPATKEGRKGPRRLMTSAKGRERPQAWKTIPTRTMQHGPLALTSPSPAEKERRACIPAAVITTSARTSGTPSGRT